MIILLSVYRSGQRLVVRIDPCEKNTNYTARACSSKALQYLYIYKLRICARIFSCTKSSMGIGFGLSQCVCVYLEFTEEWMVFGRIRIEFGAVEFTFVGLPAFKYMFL